MSFFKDFFYSLTKNRDVDEQNFDETLIKQFGAKKQIVALLVFLIFATVPFWFFPLDFYAQDIFFCVKEKSLWCHGNRPLWNFLYHYGVWPAGILAISSVLFLIFSNNEGDSERNNGKSFRFLNFKFLKKKKIYAIFILLSIVLGPGLIINSVLKMQCGRPRPRETVQYQGTWQYHNVLEKGVTGKGKSFPCGHCSMGFVFMAFYFIYYRKQKKIAYLFLTMGIAFGFLIGLARMSQGGHFLSDVMWSGITVFFSAWLLYHYILKIPKKELREEYETKLGIVYENKELSQKKSIVLYGILLVAILMGILLATPVFKERSYVAPLNLHNKPYRFFLQCDRCNVHIRFVQDANMLFSFEQTVQGFGFPGAEVFPWFSVTQLDGTNYYKLSIRSFGFFTELVDTIELQLSIEYLDSLLLEIDEGDIILEDKNLSIFKPNIFLRQKEGELNANKNLLPFVKELTLKRKENFP